MSAVAPTPWKADWTDARHPGELLHLRSADGKTVAIVYGATVEQRAANARMLEAGPEMLAALKGAADFLNPHTTLYGDVKRAIAKAEAK